MIGFVMTSTVADSMESTGQVHIIDLDQTELTAKIIQELEDSGYEVRLADLNDSLENTMAQENWQEAAVLTEGFSKSITEEHRAGEIYSISVLNTTSVVSLSLTDDGSTEAVSAAVQKVLSTEYLGKDLQFFTDPVEITSYTAANGALAQISSYTLVNSLSLFDQLMPLLLFILVVLTSQTIITAVSAEKTDKTLETLLSSPASRTSILGAKMLAALLVALLYAAVYAIGFLAAMLPAVSGSAENINLGTALSDMVNVREAAQTLGLQISFGGWLLIILQFLLTMGIVLVASLILGALVQDTKGSQMASLPILICTMFPYLFSMIGNIRQVNGILRILLWLIPFTHTFTATSCLRFHDTGMLCFGLVYQTVFLALLIAAALKLYNSDVLFIGWHFRRRKRVK
jgi:ABC-2 type transport system permease protein